MTNCIGKSFTLSIFGESHGTGVGGTVSGCPANLELKIEDIQKELDRRKPGQSSITTQRKEEDKVHIFSGVYDNITTGQPIDIFIYNKDADSSKYEALLKIHRPGHADYTYSKKYGHRDWRGGGFSSGRLTAPIVAAGAIAKKILRDHNIKIIGYTKAIGEIEAENIDFDEIEKNSVRCPDNEKAKLMENKILEIKNEGDSIGGLVEVVAKGVLAGLGGPRFDNLKGEFDKAFHSSGAITNIGYGAGSKARYMRGSEFNDQMYSENGKIKFYSNNSGGIQGGITNGQDIEVSLTIRPTPSISKEQKTVDIYGNNTIIKIEGRHDPCLCPRIVPVAEALMAIVLVDQLKQNNYLK